jgi:uncharacterized protein (TIGR00369 family)
MRPVPEHGPCFVCGTQNPATIGARWFVDEQSHVHAELCLSERQQGPPEHAHGGALAALLDEAMGLAVWYAGHKVLAVNLTVDYRRPVPLGVPCRVEARLVEQQGRKLFTEGAILLPGGEIAAHARGIFVEAQHFFER